MVKKDRRECPSCKSRVMNYAGKIGEQWKFRCLWCGKEVLYDSL